MSERDQLDRDVLTAWLNFANGAVEWNELVDTNRNGIPDTPCHVAMQTAESCASTRTPRRRRSTPRRAIVQSINDTT